MLLYITEESVYKYLSLVLSNKVAAQPRVLWAVVIFMRKVCTQEIT